MFFALLIIINNACVSTISIKLKYPEDIRCMTFVDCDPFMDAIQMTNCGHPLYSSARADEPIIIITVEVI